MTEPTQAAPRQTTKVMQAVVAAQQTVVAAHSNVHAWWRWPLGLGFFAWCIFERYFPRPGVTPNQYFVWVLLGLGIAVVPGVAESATALAKSGIGLWQTFKGKKEESAP